MRLLIALLLLAPALAPAATLRESAAKRGILIGTAVDTGDIAHDETYAATLRQQFNMIEAENEMKWAAIEPTQGVFNFTPGDSLAAFAKANGMHLRGHNLLWHSYNPRWLAKGDFTPAQLHAILEAHIAAVAAHFQGKVFAWDVVNEALAHNGELRDSIWYNHPGIGLSGPGYIDQAFRWARAADPHALLFYNDYDVEDATHNPKSDAMYDLVKGMLARGVPIDGVGLQLHVTANPASISPAGLDANIARLTALGLQVHLTELDVRIPVDSNGSASADALAAQAKVYGDIVTVCLKHPRCTAIQTWGFTDKHSWIPHVYKGSGAALPFDANFHAKPAFAAIQQALDVIESSGN